MGWKDRNIIMGIKFEVACERKQISLSGNKGVYLVVKKRISRFFILFASLFLASVVVYTASLLFYDRSETSNFTKGSIFEFNLETGFSAVEVLPGDSVSVLPTITNDATEEMYVFIAVYTPTFNDISIYDYEINDGWVLVEASAGKQVYAYATDNVMTILNLAESTSALTTQLTMRDIGNAAYAGIEDVNVTISGYAIGVEDVSTAPDEAWIYCKQIGNIE